jgi:hypothetical protein
MRLTEVSTDLDDIADQTSRIANTAGERAFLNLLPFLRSGGRQGLPLDQK